MFHMANKNSNLLLFAHYNTWANSELIRVIAKLSKEDFEKKLPGSFAGIQPTILHIADAQHVWHARLIRVPFTSWPSKDFQGSKENAIQELRQTTQNLETWVKENIEIDMDESYSFNTLNGTSQSSTFAITLMHVFNHSTYHRGQLVNFLRALGQTEIPSTDLIFYMRHLEGK